MVRSRSTYRGKRNSTGGSGEVSSTASYGRFLIGPAKADKSDSEAPIRRSQTLTRPITAATATPHADLSLALSSTTCIQGEKVVAGRYSISIRDFIKGVLGSTEIFKLGIGYRLGRVRASKNGWNRVLSGSRGEDLSGHGG